MNTLALNYLKELEAEAPAARKCLERIPESMYDYKPHEKSMVTKYLALMVAEMPKWVASSITGSEIDFATWERFDWKTSAELVAHFDNSMDLVKKALQNTTDEILLNETFYLKNHGQVLMSSSKNDNTSSLINHWVHHRGQLTVYMRLKDIPVPSIYGPSADEKTF